MHHESGERGPLVYRYTGNSGARSGEYLVHEDGSIPAKSLYQADLDEMTAAQRKAVEANAKSAHAIYRMVEPKAPEPEAPAATRAASSKSGEGK